MLSRRLGPWDVSCIGLGAMPLSVEGRPEEAEAIAVIHAALDAGMTWIDTADVYCLDHRDIGHNERLIARAIRGRNVLVATKGGLERPDGDWTCNGRAQHMQAACEASIRALGAERIALYQIHAPDDEVPWAETVGAVARLREQGKVEAVGLSNVTVEQIEEARDIVPVVSVQNRCNVLDRSAWDDGVIAYCEVEGISFLPYSPVGGGSGERSKIGKNPVLGAIARHHGATSYEVALAWLLAKCPVALPIPGASKVHNARSSARAGALQLSAAEVRQIDAQVRG